MNNQIILPVHSLTGYYSKLKEEITLGSETKEVILYSVVIEVSQTKSKLINLYKYVSGEWITDIAESEVELRNEIRKQIQVHEEK